MISARTRLSIAAVIAIVLAAPALGAPALLKFGTVKGESTDDKHKDQIEILSFSWGSGAAAGSPTTVASSDPQEGGEFAGRANDRLKSAGPRTGWDTSDPQEGGQVTGGPVYTSDPQEGGQIARTKPTVSEIQITKVQDKPSTTLASSDPEEGGEVTAPGRKAGGGPLETSTGRGEAVQSVMPYEHSVNSPRDSASGQATGKRMHKPVTMTQGNVIVLMPEGICVPGSHYPAVTLTSGDQAYEMQDVTVAGCAPVTTAKGKKTQAKLNYMVVTMKEAFITG